MSFFHKVGFANPTLWKKTTYYFVKIGQFTEFEKCYSYC